MIEDNEVQGLVRNGQTRGSTHIERAGAAGSFSFDLLVTAEVLVEDPVDADADALGVDSRPNTSARNNCVSSSWAASGRGLLFCTSLTNTRSWLVRSGRL